jgi:hypothetical protein
MPNSASPSSRTARSFDESEVRLRDFDRSEGLSFLYVYDFGDNWKHVVEFERLPTLDPAPRGATCIHGARARPPEDVGGVHGYAGFLEIDNPEHRDAKRWVGGHFDPEWFDREMADKDARNAPQSQPPHPPLPAPTQRPNPFFLNVANSLPKSSLHMWQRLRRLQHFSS